MKTDGTQSVFPFGPSVPRRRYPQPGDGAPGPLDRRRHPCSCRNPLVPGGGQAGAGAPRHQRDRTLPAARRLRAQPIDRASGGPRLGGDLRLRARRPVVLHRGDGAFLPAADPVPARHRRARGLLRELRPPPPPSDLLHAPLPARDRARPDAATEPLSGAARRPDPARLRPPAATDPRRRRDRRPTEGDARSGPRRRQRRPERVDLAFAGAADDRPHAQGRDPPPALRPGAGKVGKQPQRRPALRRRDPPAPLRPRRRQHPDARRARLRAAIRRGAGAIRDFGRASKGLRLAPAPGLGSILERLAGTPR